MLKSEPFNAVILTEDLGDGRTRKYVVDTDTGEVMLKTCPQQENCPVLKTKVKSGASPSLA